MKFEYLSEILPLAHFQTALNSFGEQGWELVNFHVKGDHVSVLAVFKRQLK